MFPSSLVFDQRSSDTVVPQGILCSIMGLRSRESYVCIFQRAVDQLSNFPHNINTDQMTMCDVKSHSVKRTEILHLTNVCFCLF